MTDLTHEFTTPLSASGTKAVKGAKRRNTWARLVDAVIALRMQQARRVIEQHVGRRASGILAETGPTQGLNDDVNAQRDWLHVSRPRD